MTGGDRRPAAARSLQTASFDQASCVVARRVLEDTSGVGLGGEGTPALLGDRARLFLDLLGGRASELQAGPRHDIPRLDQVRPAIAVAGLLRADASLLAR